MTGLFSYVVAHDTGFAPNPFHGWCTLACCKPRIRGRAQPGDLVVGLSRRSERVVIVMEVGERLTFADYWRDRRFKRKRPAWTSRRLLTRCGDNIYRPLPGGDYEQQPSQHWDHEVGQENPRTKQHDTAVDAVLAGREFVYFGGEGPALPEDLDFLAVTRGHRSRFTAGQVALAREFFEGCPRGVVGRPTLWADDDTSWRAACGSS